MAHISRMVVTQQFENPFTERIEAVYTFPLPQNAGVDDMTMNVGDRTIRGRILPREQAQAVYEGAKARGYTARLRVGANIEVGIGNRSV